VTIGVPVGMWDFDHCDPKRCSGKKLERHRLMTSLRVGSRFRGIVLSYVIFSSHVKQADSKAKRKETYSTLR